MHLSEWRPRVRNELDLVRANHFLSASHIMCFSKRSKVRRYSIQRFSRDTINDDDERLFVAACRPRPKRLRIADRSLSFPRAHAHLHLHDDGLYVWPTLPLFRHFPSSILLHTYSGIITLFFLSDFRNKTIWENHVMRDFLVHHETRLTNYCYVFLLIFGVDRKEKKPGGTEKK